MNRRIAALATLTLALVGAWARPAFAQPTVSQERTESFRSPQNWALEIRIGPYYPAIDDELGGDPEQRPHRLYFGKKPRIMTQLELDYQFFDLFGTAAIGFNIGYFRESAKAFVETSNGAVSAERSNDTTSLMLVPLGVSLVYRLDVAARRWSIPVVPYGKIGLGYTIWSITEGNGNVARTEAPNGRGRGATPGWQAAAGLSFLLDIIDPGAARELDSEIGVNHTYLFIEAAHFDASGLGKRNVLRVGDTTWLAGLMFEF